MCKNYHLFYFVNWKFFYRLIYLIYFHRLEIPWRTMFASALRITLRILHTGNKIKYWCITNLFCNNTQFFYWPYYFYLSINILYTIIYILFFIAFDLAEIKLYLSKTIFHSWFWTRLKLKICNIVLSPKNSGCLDFWLQVFILIIFNHAKQNFSIE